MIKIILAILFLVLVVYGSYEVLRSLTKPQILTLLTTTAKIAVSLAITGLILFTITTLF